MTEEDAAMLSSIVNALSLAVAESVRAIVERSGGQKIGKGYIPHELRKCAGELGSEMQMAKDILVNIALSLEGKEGEIKPVSVQPSRPLSGRSSSPRPK